MLSRFRFSVDDADSFRLRNLRRQSVRHSHHSFSRLAQSGQIPVSLRPEPRCGQSRAQVWSRLYSRTSAQRRVCVDSGAVHSHIRPIPIITSRILRSFSTLRQVRHALRQLFQRRALLALLRPLATAAFLRTFNVSRLYAEDSWRVSHHLTVNYGLRYQTTFGLFEGSGRSQAANMRNITCCHVRICRSVPHDDRKQIAPRLGIAYSPGDSEKTVIRAGFGMFYNDLAQNGWATAFQASIRMQPQEHAV